MRLRIRLWVIASIAFVVLASYSWLRWKQFEVAGYDLGIFDQVVRAYANFQVPIVSLKGDGFNIWGDHFHPILALLAPLYWIWDDARMLLLAQAGLIAVSIPIVGQFAARKMSARPAISIAIGYGFGWAIQAMVDFDFHEIVFAVPLLALALDALDRRRDWLLILSCFALIFVREDMGIMVMLFGVLRLFRKPRWPASILLVLGPTAFVVVTKVILPAFSPTGKFAYWAYDALGPDATSSIIYMVTNPIATIVLFFTPLTKLQTFVLLFAPGLFLAFRSPTVILTLPILAQRFFASRESLWYPQFHYNAPLWVIAVMASVDGAYRLKSAKLLWLRSVLGFSLAAWAIVPTLAQFPVAPLRNFLSGEIFRISDLVHQQRATLDRIPPGTCVEADDRLAFWLIRSNYVTLPGLGGTPPDFLALDLSQRTVGTTPTPYPRVNYLLARQDGWIDEYRYGPLVLLRNPNYSGPSERCRPR